MADKPRSDKVSRDKRPAHSLSAEVEAVIKSLKRLATRSTLDGMARYGIPSDNAFGVSMAAMQKLAKRLGQNHELALALWATGYYEARTVAVFVEELERLTPAQMDQWCRDFDNWAICDTACFKLFDRSPHAFRKVEKWAKRKNEFEKRGAFALLACLALHDRKSSDEQFLKYLPLIERAAADERNFVKKGVSWALRAIGRRSPALNKASVELARRLSESSQPAARWIGKDALREITSAAVTRRLRQQ